MKHFGFERCIQDSVRMLEFPSLAEQDTESHGSMECIRSKVYQFSGISNGDAIFHTLTLLIQRI